MEARRAPGHETTPPRSSLWSRKTSIPAGRRPSQIFYGQPPYEAWPRHTACEGAVTNGITLERPSKVFSPPPWAASYPKSLSLAEIDRGAFNVRFIALERPLSGDRNVAEGSTAVFCTAPALLSSMSEIGKLIGRAPARSGCCSAQVGFSKAEAMPECGRRPGIWITRLLDAGCDSNSARGGR